MENLFSEEFQKLSMIHPIAQKVLSYTLKGHSTIDLLESVTTMLIKEQEERIRVEKEKMESRQFQIIVYKDDTPTYQTVTYGTFLWYKGPKRIIEIINYER